MKTISDVKLNYLIQKVKDLLTGKAATNHTHLYAGSIKPGGNANAADQLAKTTNMIVDLSTENYSAFNGSNGGDLSLGVTGVLPRSHGGLGSLTLGDLAFSLGSTIRIRTGSYIGTGEKRMVFLTDFIPCLIIVQPYYGRDITPLIGVQSVSEIRNHTYNQEIEGNVDPSSYLVLDWHVTNRVPIKLPDGSYSNPSFGVGIEYRSTDQYDGTFKYNSDSNDYVYLIIGRTADEDLIGVENID